MKDKLPNYKDYQKSIIAFIDILGFNSKVKKIKDEESFNQIAKLLYAIKMEAEVRNRDDDIFNGFELLAISDSLIITVPYTNPIATMGVIHLIQHIQYTLLATEFRTILRGYIDIGNVYHKDGLLFGPGYSEVYEQESKIGYAPRVVLSSKIIDDAKSKINYVKETNNIEKFKTIFNYIIKDPDDQKYFIDYLKPYDKNKN